MVLVAVLLAVDGWNRFEQMSSCKKWRSPEALHARQLLVPSLLGDVHAYGGGMARGLMLCGLTFDSAAPPSVPRGLRKKWAQPTAWHAPQTLPDEQRRLVRGRATEVMRNALAVTQSREGGESGAGGRRGAQAVRAAKEGGKVAVGPQRVAQRCALEPGDLVEDASFEAVSAFAAERSLYPRCIARLPGESWRLCWAALSAVVHAISAEELYGRMGERYDARGTDLWYEDATEACTWLLFGAPEVPDAVTRSRARPLRRLVRAYVARILGGTLDPRVRAAALPRAMAAATRLADAGLHRLAGKILLGAAPTEDASGDASS